MPGQQLVQMPDGKLQIFSSGSPSSGAKPLAVSTAAGPKPLQIQAPLTQAVPQTPQLAPVAPAKTFTTLPPPRPSVRYDYMGNRLPEWHFNILYDNLLSKEILR